MIISCFRTCVIRERSLAHRKGSFRVTQICRCLSLPEWPIPQREGVSTSYVISIHVHIIIIEMEKGSWFYCIGCFLFVCPNMNHSYSFLTSTVLAPPPPLQILATPYWPFSKCNARLLTIRAPDMPIGWPRETAPPLMFTRLGSSFSNLMLARTTALKASLISQRLISLTVSPAILRACHGMGLARGFVRLMEHT